MIRKRYYKTHEQWLKGREMGIGSSEVGTIMGINPFETPLQLWRRKKGIDAPKQETEIMTIGHEIEPCIASHWEKETGLKVIKSSAAEFVIYDTETPYMRVSPDRTYWAGNKRNEGNKGILECKSTRKTIHADNIPPHWIFQLQYQMGVSGYKFGHLAWLINGTTFGTEEIPFDKECFDYIKNEVTEFWKRHIIGDEEPAPITTDDIRLLFPTSREGENINADSELLTAANDLAALKKEIKVRQAEADTLEEKIKMAMCDAERLISDGRIIATWKSSKPALRLDTAALKKELPDIFAKYAKEGKSARTFRLYAGEE